jgi:hypothetical protein
MRAGRVSRAHLRAIKEAEKFPHDSFWLFLHDVVPAVLNPSTFNLLLQERQIGTSRKPLKKAERIHLLMFFGSSALLSTTNLLINFGYLHRY